jgi:hypothetical protein
VRNITSLITTLDLVPTTGAPATPYEVAGIVDGLGAFDNGNGTVTILANHELGSGSGVTRRHGAIGSFVVELIVDKNTLQVLSAQDLIHTVVDAAGVEHNAANSNAVALNRFCSSDLADVAAYYNAASGLGTQERIYFKGEEGGSNGWAIATVATGVDKGRAYILPRFNLATNGSGINAVGGWENLIASPFPQDLTIVAGTNDGGSGIMNNTVNVYVGTKQSTGSVVERAGLTNGTNYIVGVAGNPAEIVNSTSRATNITSGTRFTLNLNAAGTTFSRPEDGAWDPTNPRDFYFVTTDRLDTNTSTGFNQTIGASGPANQNGKSRLWRLRFDDITNPLLGGVVDLLIDGSEDNQKVNMLDNMCVAADGTVFMTEDPGNSTYSGKSWAYDPTTDMLLGLTKMDEARWGDLAVNGGTPGAVAPHANDKEISGVIDVTSMFPHAADEQVLLIDVQDHSSNPAVANAASVEGGQLLLMRVALAGRAVGYGAGCGGLGLAAQPGSRPVLGSTFLASASGIAPSATTFMMIGLSSATFAGLPLPLELSFVGMPGCFLHQDMAIDFAGGMVPSAPSTASYLLPVPSSFQLVGATIYLQAWTSTLQNSNGLSVVVGF